MFCPVQSSKLDMISSGAANLDELVYHKFTPEFLRSVWPADLNPPIDLSGMNAKETAVWVEMLSGFKRWNEARSYSKAFINNDICGYMLPYLTVESLKDELGIVKLGHRLEVLLAIRENELTLRNPTIASLCPNKFFVPGSSQDKCGLQQKSMMKVEGIKQETDIRGKTLSSCKRVAEDKKLHQMHFEHRGSNLLCDTTHMIQDFTYQQVYPCKFKNVVKEQSQVSRFPRISSLLLPASIVIREEFAEVQFGPWGRELEKSNTRPTEDSCVTCLDILTVLADGKMKDGITRLK